MKRNTFFIIWLSTLSGCNTLNNTNMHPVRQSSIPYANHSRDHMAVRSKGSTVSFREVPDFAQLSLEEATRIVYDELIPACENKEVMLSGYGNHNATDSLCNLENYNTKKIRNSLFNVERIQKAFVSIPNIVQSHSQYRIGSYGLKHVVERDPSHNEYIPNGELIAAMLLKGYKARFGKRNETIGVNCEFQVKIKNREMDRLYRSH